MNVIVVGWVQAWLCEWLHMQWQEKRREVERMERSGVLYAGVVMREARGGWHEKRGVTRGQGGRRKAGGEGRCMRHLDCCRCWDVGGARRQTTREPVGGRRDMGGMR